MIGVAVVTAASKSIPFPMRCLISLNQVLGLSWVSAYCNYQTSGLRSGRLRTFGL